MNYLLQAMPTKIKILAAGLIASIIIITILLALQTNPQHRRTSTPESPALPLQKIKIGEKVPSNIENNFNITSKEATTEGKVIYSLESQNAIRTDQIITQNNQVIFQRVYVPESPNDPNHLLISSMISRYGTPEKTIQGSKLWGPFIMLYIYSNKGLAFIGNPNTDEVYELQTFSPTSVDDYIQKYGDDIDNTPPGGES
jgi:hypothetical protein